MSQILGIIGDKVECHLSPRRDTKLATYLWDILLVKSNCDKNIVVKI